MRSVFDMGHSHFDTGGPSPEHNENFLTQHKGRFGLEFGQFFSDLRDLNRLWTGRDFYGQTAAPSSVLENFSFGPILRPTCEEMRRQWRISAPALLNFAHDSKPRPDVSQWSAPSQSEDSIDIRMVGECSDR